MSKITNKQRSRKLQLFYRTGYYKLKYNIKVKGGKNIKKRKQANAI